MEASVKIMRSYNYNHFEISLSKECEDLRAVNELRKDAQRLSDEAVRQFQKAKEMAGNRDNAKFEKENFLAQVRFIQEKPEGERTVNEMAILKQFKDEVWEEQFEYPYDYEDDEIDSWFR